MNCPFENMKEQLKTGVKAVSSDQLFTTPPELAERMADMLCIDEESHVLEPSAGTGVLIDAIIDTGCEITACEISTDLCEGLYNKVNNVLNCDFMDVHLVRETRYDAVIMNPPFSMCRDIKHIKRAYRMLREGGQLVAICGNGGFQNKQLKPWVEERGGIWEVLPEGTFKQSGTMVNTVLIYVER